MAYESNIRKHARVLQDALWQIRSEQKKICSLTDNVHQWWKGKGGEAFAVEYRSISDNDVVLQRYIQNAADGLNRLPALIQRAERERREAAERAALKKQS